jgi:hypothetical protein
MKSKLLIVSYSILSFGLLLTNSTFGELTNNSKIKGRIVNNNIENTGIEKALLYIISTNIGCYTDENGYFCIESADLNSNGFIFTTKYNFIPKITEYDLNEDSIFIELIPTYNYFYTPPLSGPFETYDTVYIKGYIYDSKSNIPLSGVLVYLADFPYSTISKSDGSFVLKPSKVEIEFSSKKQLNLFFERKGYQNEIITISKSSIIKVIQIKEDIYNCNVIKLEKFIAPEEIRDEVLKNINLLVAGINIVEPNCIDSSFLDEYHLTLENLYKSINAIDHDTTDIFELNNNIILLKNKQEVLLELSAQQNKLDSLNLLAFYSLKGAIETNNESIDNLNQINETIINSLKSLGLNLSSTRDSLDKKIEDNIIKFNENARILNESYLKRSRQYDTTAFQVFLTIPVTLGPRYPDFISASPLGQIGINTNFGARVFQRSKIYFSASYNFLSFANSDTNYHELEDGTVLYANTKSISANYATLALNFRPPIDFISNLKIDPGVGVSFGYDYKNIEYYKTNDTLPKLSFQAYIQVAVQYKLFTPPPNFTFYDANNFTSNSDDLLKLYKSGVIDSNDYFKKYAASFESYNYKKSKTIKRKQVFQNLGHNTYIYFNISDRLVFKDKKYLYGLANFALGLKFDISSYVNNQKTMKANCRATNYCHPSKPVF